MKRSRESGTLARPRLSSTAAFWIIKVGSIWSCLLSAWRYYHYASWILTLLLVYRMTLRSRDTKSLESACAEIVARSKNQGFETKGPVRIPTKILRITTRKSPCGEGSKTWDRFEMRIHKRVIDIHCPSSVVKEITNFRIEAGVDVNLMVWKQWSVGESLSSWGERPQGEREFKHSWSIRECPSLITLWLLLKILPNFPLRI